MTILGTVMTGDGLYMVCWHEGDRITIPALGVLIATDTRDRGEALSICNRNFRNFTER